MNTLEIVLKLTERCNIDCTYCYVFNKGDESYKTNPPKIKKKTIIALKEFIQDSVFNNQISSVQINLHGGEPLLLGKKKFQEYINILNSVVLPHNNHVNFSVQTNATLISNEWIDLISKNNISVGISLDGPKHLNDKHRIDFKGKGTYDRTLAGFKLLKDAYDRGDIVHIGILSVSSPNISSISIYNHFVNELGIKSFDLLFPTESHDNFNISECEGYKQYYKDLFKAWSSEEPNAVQIRTIQQLLSQLVNGKEVAAVESKAREGKHVIITVSSSGDIGPDDSLRTLSGEHFSELNVIRSNYSDVLNSKMFKKILKAENTIPDDCVDCSWKMQCRGGATGGRLVNRYKSNSGFNNKSIMCSTLDELYTELSAYLLKNGFTFEKLQESLFEHNFHLTTYDSKQVEEEILL